MNNSLRLLATLAGFAGLAICAVFALLRLAGHYSIAGFETMTIFEGGVGLMVAGCFLKLHAQEARQ
ncbi:MAG: hypothetical protein HYV16_13955 [Gammaproteobacteria bacterium]|nr:hypothetical protein [Gammaproteobacteria bacterium]